MAMRDFLRALGQPVDEDPELRETPERVAQAFYDELLSGSRAHVADALADTLPTTEPGMVVLTNIAYATMCPHHLLPSTGVAHIGYLPGQHIVGIGALVRLVEVLSRRLTLQEAMGQRIADALVTYVGARASGVVLDASHMCMVARGERQTGARMVTQSFAGEWLLDVNARSEFQGAVSMGRRP
jgi:GTP cyclohydrolase IA